MHASPSDATTLSVWELNYILGKITIDEIMSRDVITVNEDLSVIYTHRHSGFTRWLVGNVADRVVNVPVLLVHARKE